MKGSALKFDHESFWSKVNNPEKFELLSYLILCLKYPNIRWHKTPKTRDHKRDAEGHDGDQKLFLEAKFITDFKVKKLSHYEVGSNINIAIYELADILLIFTNGYIQLDLLNFIITHNEIHEAILLRPLKIITFNRDQIIMHAIKYSSNDFYKKLNEIELIGYKSLNKKEIENRKQELIDIGEDIIKDISEVKKESLNDFFYSPTFRSIVNFDWPTKEKFDIVNSLFQIEIYYDWTSHGTGMETIKVPIGNIFYILIKINNFFFDDIAFSINLISHGLIKLVGPMNFQLDRYTMDDKVAGASERIICLAVRAERLPFKGIEITFLIDRYRLIPSIGKIEVQNLFFLSPFIGEKNHDNLASFKEKVDRTVYHKTFFLGLLTGEAGIGKSRLIQEVIDHGSKYNLKLFRTELIAAEGRNSFLGDLISFFLGVDPKSFINISDQLITRFKSDKNFSELFSSDKEFVSFKNSLREIIAFGINAISFAEIDKIADFVSKILLRLGRKYLTMIVIEDLHHGDRRLFYFIYKLYNFLKIQKSRIVFLLAARTEAKELTSAFRKFELIISNDQVYSINKTEILPLSDKDSLALIKELVITESKFEKYIKQNILEKTGNNPFNIIHTLLHLKNKGIIVERENDFEWHYLNKLEDINIHLEITKLLNERFKYYFSMPEIGQRLFDLISIICLFETKIKITELEKIIPFSDLEHIIDFLRRERIIKTEEHCISFDHENLFQYVQEHILTNAQNAAENIIKWIRLEKLEDIHLPLLVRSLNVAFLNYSEDFFSYTWRYFQNLLAEDDWKKLLRYGELFLKRIKENNKYVIPLKKFEVMFVISDVLTEYSNLDVAIQSYEKLDLEIKEFLHKILAISNDKKFQYYILQMKTRLYCCDAIIMSGEYLKARIILVGLNEEINEFKKKYKKHKNNKILNEINCWALNRLGITFRALGEPEKALDLINESLTLAKKIKHDYFMHHNYYDMGGCLIHLNKIKDAYKMHKKCLTSVLNLPNRTNAKIRSQIRTGIFHTFFNDPLSAEIELENAIQLAQEKSYLWELTRGLINQGNLHFTQKNFELALKTYKTCLHYIDIHNSKNFQLCLYNNLGFLYFYFYSQTREIQFLEDSLNCFLKITEGFKSSVRFVDVKNLNTYHLLSILNLFIYKELLSTHPNKSPRLYDNLKSIEATYQQLFPFKNSLHKPHFIKRFILELSENISFYLMYMSFS